MATGLRVQPQRVPIGELEINGRRLQVFVTREWLAELQRIAAAADSSSDGSSEEDDLSPALAVHVSGRSLESGPDPADRTAAVLLCGLRERVDALELETLVRQLAAQVHDLRAQVEALQQQPL